MTSVLYGFRIGKVRLVLAGAFALANMFHATPSIAFEPSLISPADDALAEQIKATSLVFSAKSDNITNPQDIVAAARADYAQILSTLYRRGYYGGTISITVDGQEAADMSVFFTPRSVNRVTLRVDPGKQFRFGNVSIAPQAPGTVLPEDFATGQPAHSTVIGKATTASIIAWRDIGYAKASRDGQTITANHRNQTLDANVHLNPGTVVKFGKMQFADSGNVRPQRIREIAGFPTGEVFSPEKMNEVVDRLRDTGTFRTVAMTEDSAVAADGSMDIFLELIEEKPRRFGFGAEIYSREGLSVSGLWMHRNIFGGAENLAFRGEISGIGSEDDEIDYRLTARLTRPGTISARHTFFVGVEVAALNEPVYSSVLTRVEAGITRKISSRTDVSGSLSYRYSKDIDDFGEREFNHLILSFAGERDARDITDDPTKGTYASAEAAPYLGLYGSASGMRLFADTRGYYTPGISDSVTLAGRFQLGSIIGSGLAETPQEMLFFSGGGGTVRGQPYQSLFVTKQGFESGGLSFLGLSAEARIGVTDTIGVVAFADAGFIGSTPLPGQTGNWHSGVGLGLRYKTGFGPIRLDLALPTSGNTGDGLQFYVGVGQAF